MNFKFDASDLLKGLADREIKVRASLGLYADTVSKKWKLMQKAIRLGLIGLVELNKV